MPKDIHEAAYDGDLTTVTNLLTQNPQLLDKPFKEDCLGLIGVPVSNIVFGLKKIASAGLALFTVACAAVTTVETAGAGAVMVPTLASFTVGVWYAGDKGMEYYMTNINNWTPLDCAVYGYVKGNESAVKVAEYLMQQGANGAASRQPDKRLFETFGNGPINILWRREQASRVQRQQLNQLRAEKMRIEHQLATVNEQSRNLQEGLNAEMVNRTALFGALAAKKQELEALQAERNNIDARLAQFLFVSHNDAYDFWRTPRNAAQSPNPAAMPANEGAATQQPQAARM